jgi:hypothetical protein
MHRSLGFEFVLYGVLLSGLGFLTYRAAPDLTRVTLFTGIGGGVLGVLWGVLNLCGYKRRWWAVLTLAAVSAILLSQLVMIWGEHGDELSKARLAGLGMFVMLVFSFGLLMNVLHGQGRSYDAEDRIPKEHDGSGRLSPSSKSAEDKR